MGTYQIYQAINNSTIELIESFNPIAPPEIKERISYVRLEENPFHLTDETAAVRDLVTAHKLKQYKNRFKTIKLEENIEVKLDKLLAVHREVE